MSSRYSGRRARWLLPIVATAALSALLWFFGLSPIDRLVAWKWRCQIDAADDREALGEVSRIAALGEAGLAELAALLGSERLCVAEAVRQALGDEMRRWPHLDPDSRRRRQLTLASSLSEQIEQFSPDARCVASDIALRILSVIPANDASESAIVAACDQVLRASAVQRRQRLLARRPGSDESNANRRGSAEFEENRVPRLASLPGGSLFPTGLEASTPPFEAIADSGDRVVEEDHRDLATNEPARLPEPSTGPMNDAVETDQELEAAAATLHHNAAPTGNETEEEAGDEAAAVLRWMFALRSNEPSRRHRAEEELKALGFEALQLELAMQLTDPSPSVRRELAESLPAMPGIDARTWLLWLSRDQHPDVRLTAMSVMATTGDVNVMRRIEQMARRDVDPRVQRQGEQLLKVLQADSRTPSGGSRPVAR